MNTALPENGLLPLIGSAPAIAMAAAWLFGEKCINSISPSWGTRCNAQLGAACLQAPSSRESRKHRD